MTLTDSEKANLYKRTMKYPPPNALMLYHPSTDRWIPAVCDEKGYIKIDPEELDTRYHKKNENLDLNGYDILNTNFRLKTGIYGLTLRNVADTGYGDVLLKNIWMANGSFYPAVGNAGFYAGVNKRVFFSSYDGGIRTEIYLGGTGEGLFFIPLAAPSNPVKGSFYYDSVADKLKVYTGAAFETITSA